MEVESKQERILATPTLAKIKSGQSDDWSTLPVSTRPEIAAPLQSGGKGDDDDLTESERRHQPELNRINTIEKRAPIDNEFALDTADEMEDDTARLSRMKQAMRQVARQASLDPGDGIEL